MTILQKVIKYLAIAFAVVLVVNITFTAWYGIKSLAGVIGINGANSHNASTLKIISKDIDESDIHSLTINLKNTNLKIVEGDVVKVESNSESVFVNQINGDLSIKESNMNGFGFFDNQTDDLVVYLPRNMKFDKILIEDRVGKVNASNLNANEIEFKSGTGETQIDSISATDKAKLESGVGKLIVNNAKLNNLEFDLGVGEVELNGVLNGNTSLDAGVGKVSVNLENSIDDYRFVVDKGIGDIVVDGVSLSDKANYGKGSNLIDINGGIGAVEVKAR